MPNPIIMTNVTGVEFGTLGTVNIKGGGQGGEEIRFSIPITALQSLIPELAKAATAAMMAPAGQGPNNGDPVREGLVAVTRGNAFAARDTREPCLTLHTCGGLLQFCFPSDAAIEIGKELVRIATEARGPGPAGAH